MTTVLERTHDHEVIEKLPDYICGNDIVKLGMAIGIPEIKPHKTYLFVHARVSEQTKYSRPAPNAPIQPMTFLKGFGAFAVTKRFSMNIGNRELNVGFVQSWDENTKEPKNYGGGTLELLNATPSITINPNSRMREILYYFLMMHPTRVGNEPAWQNEFKLVDSAKEVAVQMEKQELQSNATQAIFDADAVSLETVCHKYGLPVSTDGINGFRQAILSKIRKVHNPPESIGFAQVISDLGAKTYTEINRLISKALDGKVLKFNDATREYEYIGKSGAKVDVCLVVKAENAYKALQHYLDQTPGAFAKFREQVDTLLTAKAIPDSTEDLVSQAYGKVLAIKIPDDKRKHIVILWNGRENDPLMTINPKDWKAKGQGLLVEYFDENKPQLLRLKKELS